MSTYSAITSGQIDSESIIDTVLAGQWANNILAVIEGDASAPRIAGDAALTAIIAGTTYNHAWTGEIVHLLTSAPSYTLVSGQPGWVRIVIQRAGTYTVTFSLYRSVSGGTAYGRIYKNGVAFGAEKSSSSATPTDKVEDLTFAAGDYVDLYIRESGTSSVDVKDLRIQSAIKPMG